MTSRQKLPLSVNRARALRLRAIASSYLLIALLNACGGGAGSSAPPQNTYTGSTPPTSDSTGDTSSGPGFSTVDAAFQAFIDNSDVFDGISYVVVNSAGVMHQQVFGDHSEDLIVMLASTSKVPAVMAMLALQEDTDAAFSIDEPVSTYLPYDGVYANRTVKQMVSNTSGIPGLRLLDQYGDPLGAIAGGEGGVNHLCQMSSQLHWDFETCGQILVQNELPETRLAGTTFDYGGSQWQIAGVTASIVANSTWNQLFDKYIGEPCGLEVFTFGNPWEELSFFGSTSFDGVSVESMPGQHNPQIEGGAISNLADPETRLAGTTFDYGGSQWQIAGVTASIVANSTWNQLFDKYIGEPCGLEVFTFGNPWEELSFFGSTSFDGVSVESMPGQHNPQIEGGAISNLADYAKLLQIHVNGGYCGDTRVLSEDSLAAMRENIGGDVDPNPIPYGMGWWIQLGMPGVYTDPGAFGAVSFIDVNRGIGGYMAIDDYSRVDAGAPPDFFVDEAIELIQAAVDAAN